MKDYSRLDTIIPGLRRDYHAGKLSDKGLPECPFDLFAVWFEDAIRASEDRPDMMALATATASGTPSVRHVLLKGFDERGFLFFTDYESRKGKALAENPCAEAVFFWHVVERQVTLSGQVNRTGRRESEDYFASRPRDSQLAAHASRQSEVIEDRKTLEDRVAELKKKYEGLSIPCPERWGGYRLVPDSFEFWQGRENRLNDRIRYRRSGAGWVRERIQP